VILARLRTAGAGAPDPTPKLVRALGPPALAPPDVVAVPITEPTVAAIVAHDLAAAVTELVRHDPGIRIGETPESLHQARVATRRLRSNLGTFQSLLDGHWAAELRDELRWLGDVLGGVRDTDVLLARLEAKAATLDPDDQPAALRLLDTLRAERERRRTLLLEALRSERYVTLLERLVQGSRRPRLLLRIDDEDDRTILRDLVRKPWSRLRDAAAALGDDSSDQELHALRIRAKRARYAAEAVAPGLGKPARTFARVIAGVQEGLGDHQDAVLAAEWLRRNAAATGDEAIGFAAGQLAALELADAALARSVWPDAWREARRKRYRTWL